MLSKKLLKEPKDDKDICKKFKCKTINTNKIKGDIKCNKNNNDKVLDEMEKLPNKYIINKLPKGKTDSKEKITIQAQ